MITTVLLLAIGTTQTAPDAAVQPASPFHLDFRAGVWLPRLNGDSTLGSVGSTVSLENDLELNDSQVTPNMELTGRYKEWSGVLSGFVFDTDGAGSLSRPVTIGGFAVPAGTPISSSVDMNSAALEVKYALYQPFAAQPFPWNAASSNHSHRARADLQIGPTIVLRYLDIEQDYSASGFGTISGDGTWIAVMAGLDLNLQLHTKDRIPFLEMLEFQAGGALGPAFGGDGGTLWQIRAAITAHFTRHLGLTFGYRLLEANVSDDDYEFEAGLQGLFAGITVGF